MKNLSYLLALHSVDGLGPVRLKKIIEVFKDPKVAWEADIRELKSLSIPAPVLDKLKIAKKTIDPNSHFENLSQQSVKVTTIYSDDYPDLLKEIYDPPVVLYYKGHFSKSKRLIGVVGSRKITGYGQTVTEKLTGELVEQGFVIVSGLAMGVDTIAHKTAVLNNGQTIAVLGGGLNRIFPPANIELAKRIEDGQGVVVSEYLPDYPHLAGNFPSRNRIISGLSLGVLVTEAAEGSGSLITAKCALEQGREVFAVPGPITSGMSAGTSLLIKEGAKLVTSVQDIMEELGVEGKQNVDNRLQNTDNLSELEKGILSCLNNESKQIDEIIRELGKSSSEVSGALIKLEIQGFVKNMGSGSYIRSI